MVKKNNLIKFIRYEIQDNIEFGIIYDEIFIISKNSIECLKKFNTMNEVIEKFSEENADDIFKIFKEKINLESLIKIKDVIILPPLEKVKHDIICVGLNYIDHISEMEKDIPVKTTYFSKRVTFMNGTNSDIKYDFSLDKELDYEVELAVIIGKTGKNITKTESENYIFGYTILNDLTARNIQKSSSQWYRSKSLDNLISIGPCIVYKKNLLLPLELEIKSIINREIRQSSNTKFMIKNINELIEEISLNLTLEAGDIISTGTCSGVGEGFNPPKYLKNKDIVECVIENIGVLRNNILEKL